jgi:hypothetical protein
MLPWPNSPLLVLLQFVDPNVLSGGEHQPLQEGATRATPLHHLADLTGPRAMILATYEGVVDLDDPRPPIPPIPPYATVTLSILAFETYVEVTL